MSDGPLVSVDQESLEETRNHSFHGISLNSKYTTDGDCPSSISSSPTPFAFLTRFPFLLLFCTLILFYRVPNSFLHPQLVAEDGPIFFADALELGMSSLFKPYAGQLLLFQRLVAWLVSFMPVKYAPHCYTYTALAATLAVLAYIARSRIRTPFKPLLAVAVVVCPHPDHVYLNLFNAHWILALALLAAIIADDPPTVPRAMLAMMLLTLVLLTGPFALLFLPLLGLRLLWRRSVYSLALALLALGCIGVGMWCLTADQAGLAVSRAPGKFDPWNPTWLSVYGNGFAGILLFGGKFWWNHLRSSPTSYNATLTAASVLIYLTFGVHALWRRDLRRLILLGAGFGILLATLCAFRGDPGCLIEQMGRYSFIPIVSLMWTALLTLSSGGLAARLAVVFLVVVGLASAGQFQKDPRADFHWRQESRWIGGPVPHKIDICPGPPWYVYYHPKLGPVLREPYTPVVAAFHDITWAGEVARGTGPDPYIVYALRRPTFVYGVEVWFTLTNDQKSPAAFQAFWARSSVNHFCEEERTVHFTLLEPTAPGPRMAKLTLWIFDTIDQLRLDPDAKPCAFQLHRVELLTKPAGSQ